MMGLDQGWALALETFNQLELVSWLLVSELEIHYVKY
jgi:hypothetical protein